MHWTVRYLYVLADEAEVSLRDLSRSAGLEAGTVTRWRESGRTPDLDALEAALGVLGYRLSIVRRETWPT